MTSSDENAESQSLSEGVEAWAVKPNVNIALFIRLRPETQDCSSIIPGVKRSKIGAIVALISLVQSVGHNLFRLRQA